MAPAPVGYPEDSYVRADPDIGVFRIAHRRRGHAATAVHIVVVVIVGPVVIGRVVLIGRGLIIAVIVAAPVAIDRVAADIGADRRPGHAANDGAAGAPAAARQVRADSRPRQGAQHRAGRAVGALMLFTGAVGDADQHRP